MQFLISGLTHNYIVNDVYQMTRLCKSLEESHEDASYINSIKLLTCKFSTDAVPSALPKKYASTRTVGEIVHRPKFITNTARPNMEIIHKLDDVSSKDIAFDLTRQMANIVDKISVHELIHLAMNDKCEKSLYPNLSELIAKYNALYHYVPSEILIERKTNKDRIKFIKKIIEIIQECMNVNNFVVAFALISGLGHPTIARLAELWKPKYKYVQTFITLEKFIFPGKNYETYRNHLKMCNGSILPQFSIYVSDIKHLLENEIHSTNDVMNWPIYNKLIVIIKEYENINKKYEIVSNSSIESIFNKAKICYDDDKLYQESYKILPSQRNSTAGSRIQIQYNSPSILSPTISSSAISIISTPTLTATSAAVLSQDVQSDTTTNSASSSTISLTDSTRLMLNNIPERTTTPGIMIDRHRSVNITPTVDLLYKHNKSITADKLQKAQSITLQNDDVEIPPVIHKLDMSITPIQEWSIEGVTEWLDKIQMTEYSKVFTEQAIDGHALTGLQEHHLQEMGINKIGHRVKIMNHIQHLKSSGL